MPQKLFSFNNKQFALGVLFILSLLITLSFAQTPSISGESEVGFEFEGSQALNLTRVVARGAEGSRRELGKLGEKLPFLLTGNW
jgi:hypothetical protein